MTPAVVDLRCDQRATPLGIDTTRPLLGWRLASDRRGARQVAYQIRTAADAAALASGPWIWDSGRVVSPGCVAIPYAGPPLASLERVYWDVTVEDELGATSTSASSFFETGLLARGDWQAHWIGADLVGGPRTTIPAPLLRRRFVLDRPVAQARLAITALGLYEATINGMLVTDAQFAPGWTEYATRVQYHVYDVTSLLRVGENAIATILGDGWYAGHVGWWGRQQSGDRPKLLAQLIVTHDDGSETRVTSDDAWRYTFGPVLESDMIMGEAYDARLDIPGWECAGFDDTTWQPVAVFDAPDIALTAMRGPLVRRREEFRPAPPREIRSWEVSRWIFDLGQNIAGRVRLRVSGPRGTTVTLKFAEVLDDKGELYTTNLRTARVVDYYTLKGDGVEVYEPRFTFHGFRYVEVTGLPGTLDADTITGVALYSDMQPSGTFTCSEPQVNQLQHNIAWGLRGNFLDVPTDCPQRDERLGWTGDAQVFIRTATFNMDVAGFFNKWTRDLEDSQHENGAYPSVSPYPRAFPLWDGGPAWADAGIIVPWVLYQVYGDVTLLAARYASMQRFIAYLEATSSDLIRVDEGYQGFRGFGDWVAMDPGTPPHLIGTAFFAHSAGLLGQIAGVLGHDADAARYAALRERVAAAFVGRFVENGSLMVKTQTAYVLALHFQLLPLELRPAAVAALVADIAARDTHLSTGFVGTPYLLHVLSDNDQLDLAYRLLMQTSWPSWLYPIQHGATTIWERWDAWTHDRGFQDPGMNSFNHYAYGAVGEWLYRVVAGIDLADDGSGHRALLLRPRPGGGLRHASASYESRYGTVHSAWQLSDGRLTWDVTVPPGATATAYIPAALDETISESGLALDAAAGVEVLPRRRADAAIVALASGSYQFVVARAL